MRFTRKKIMVAATALLTATSMMASVAPAQANEFAIVADQTTNLALTGQVVNVSVNNLPVSTGVYLRLCAGTPADAAKARLTNCASMADTAWVTVSRAAIAQGAAALAGPVALKVPSTFVSGATTVDCTVTACGISSRRDHLGGATDFTLDRFVPVSFAAAVIAKTGVVLEGSRVSYTILNQKGKRVSFMVGFKKYTRVATSDNFAFSAKAPKDKMFTASAFVGNKKIVGKSLRK